MSGWIKLHRKIQEHWIWQDKPFDRRSAWVDILLMANHEDNKFVLGNEVVEVKRGSFVTSELKLMERWGWGKTKTRNFLELLQNDGMIIKKSDRKKTTITLVNYSDYQDKQTTNKPRANHEQTTSKPRAYTNKNDKNDKNDKNKILYCDFVYLTDEEHQKLVERLGETQTQKMIERLNNYIGSSGRKYKSHYHTILAWWNKDQKEQEEKQKDKPEFQNGKRDLSYLVE